MAGWRGACQACSPIGGVNIPSLLCACMLQTVGKHIDRRTCHCGWEYACLDLCKAGQFGTEHHPQLSCSATFLNIWRSLSRAKVKARIFEVFVLHLLSSKNPLSVESVE